GGVVLRESAHAEAAANHQLLRRSGGKSKAGLEVGPVGLHSRGGSDLEWVATGGGAGCRQNRIGVRAVTLGGRGRAEMIPPQADVQREPRLCAPVVLDVDVGFPEAEILPFGIDLPLNFIRLALDEIGQIGEFVLRESEVTQTERVLIIVQLPA